MVWDLSAAGAGGGEPATAGGSGAAACMVSVGRTKGTVSSLAWLPSRPLPQFLTAGADGLLLWTLRADCLEMAEVELHHHHRGGRSAGADEEGMAPGGACTAVAAEEGGVVVVATASGAIYQITVRVRWKSRVQGPTPCEGGCQGIMGCLNCTG